MSTTRTEAGADYLLRLRVALADLPPGEVAEIVGDVQVQLDEADEAELARLGSPESYAAELRIAAGYPAAGAAVPVGRMSARIGLWLLGAGAAAAVLVGVYGLRNGSGSGLLVTSVVFVAAPVALGWLLARGYDGLRALPEPRRVSSAALRVSTLVPAGVRQLLTSVRPAWWVVRAGLAALLIVSTVSAGPNTRAVGLLTLLFALPSAWLAQQVRRSRGWAWVSLPLNMFAVGVGLALIAGTGQPAAFALATSSHMSIRSAPSLAVDNVYPFDSAGRPLTTIYLYDQDGKPITVVGTAASTPSDLRSLKPGATGSR